MSRRAFLGAVAAAPIVVSAAARAAGRPVRLGGPIFLKSDDPVALAKEHRRLGYSAAYCPAASPTDGDRIRAIREAFKDPNVMKNLEAVAKDFIDWMNKRTPGSYDAFAGRISNIR